MSVLAVELGFLVEEYAGTKGSIPPRKRRKKNALFVCTIEKAHSLVNSLITEKRIDSIGLVVVDEVRIYVAIFKISPDNALACLSVISLFTLNMIFFM